jgi:hypothetical protein
MYGPWMAKSAARLGIIISRSRGASPGPAGIGVSCCRRCCRRRCRCRCCRCAGGRRRRKTCLAWLRCPGLTVQTLIALPIQELSAIRVEGHTIHEGTPGGGGGGGGGGGIMPAVAGGGGWPVMLKHHHHHHITITIVITVVITPREPPRRDDDDGPRLRRRCGGARWQPSCLARSRNQSRRSACTAS